MPVVDGGPYAPDMRVLVVEDEAKMASLLRRGLEHEGYAVDVATDGVDAVWYGTEHDYDVIVLDVMIPPPNGFDVCRELPRPRPVGARPAVDGP